jgi:hypothetical protein
MHDVQVKECTFIKVQYKRNGNYFNTNIKEFLKEKKILV